MFGFGSVFTWVNEKVTVLDADTVIGIDWFFPKFGTKAVPVLELINWFVEPAVGTELVIEELEFKCEALMTLFWLSSVILDVRLVWCKICWSCCWGRTATGFGTEWHDIEEDDGLLGAGVGPARDWVCFAIKFAIFSETIAEFLRFKVWICCVCCVGCDGCDGCDICFEVSFVAMAAFAA